MALCGGLDGGGSALLVCEGLAECRLNFYFPGTCLAEVQILSLKSLRLLCLELRASLLKFPQIPTTDWPVRVKTFSSIMYGLGFRMDPMGR